MFLASFPAGPWQANCYLLALDGTRTVVIDPGVDALDTVKQVVDEQGLEVEGVLLTHGHIDHVASAQQVADHFEVPAWLHEADRELLDDPTSGRAEMAMMIAQLGVQVGVPEDLRLLVGGETVEVAGMEFEVIHAPGHRPGCVMFRLTLREPLPDAPDFDQLVFPGDVVFAGSIGRTDLPGGNDQHMRATLRTVVLGLPDSAVLLPGHGDQTSMARERATNPYLQDSYLR